MRKMGRRTMDKTRTDKRMMEQRKREGIDGLKYDRQGIARHGKDGLR